MSLGELVERLDARVKKGYHERYRGEDSAMSLTWELRMTYTYWTMGHKIGPIPVVAFLASTFSLLGSAAAGLGLGLLHGLEGRALKIDAIDTESYLRSQNSESAYVPQATFLDKFRLGAHYTNYAFKTGGLGAVLYGLKEWDFSAFSGGLCLLRYSQGLRCLAKSRYLKDDDEGTNERVKPKAGFLDKLSEKIRGYLPSPAPAPTPARVREAPGIEAYVLS